MGFPNEPYVIIANTCLIIFLQQFGSCVAGGTATEVAAAKGTAGIEVVPEEEALEVADEGAEEEVHVVAARASSSNYSHVSQCKLHAH